MRSKMPGSSSLFWMRRPGIIRSRSGRIFEVRVKREPDYFRMWLLLTLVGMVLIFFSRAEAASIGQPAPELTNTVWINSTPLQLADLRGKVILLEFWTYG